MTSTFEFEMKMASREWLRQFYTAVVRSIAKTITEPVTNSDTSYKRKLDLSDASGIVDEALSIKKGTMFDLSNIKASLMDSKLERNIDIHIYTAKGHGRESRTCEIVDFAEGLSSDQLKDAFEVFAADKSTVSKHRPGRSLFGRGVSDVLLGHKQGTFFSYHDGILSEAEFSFDPTKDKAPKGRVTVTAKPKASDLREIHLRPGENGSCVRFMLHDDCRIPEEGTIIPYLAEFYMLRLINADPNIKVRVFQYRSGRKIIEDTLDYDFPIGDVIDNFSLTIDKPVKDVALPSLNIKGIVCRANIKGGLPGGKDREQRANGLLIVDEKDAVLDLTFLPRFEDAPYLKNIFGIVRIQNIRNVFDWYLNNGKDSPLTTSRDGFDLKHEFTKVLFKELSDRLEPIYKREEERFNKTFTEDISKETRQRINDAIKELNKYLKDLIGEGEGDGPEPTTPCIDPDKVLQFVPDKIKLTLGRPRPIRLFLKKDTAKLSGGIICDANNEKIEISPLSHQISDGRKEGAYLVYVLTLKCDSLHENAVITALADGQKETIEATLEVVDVTSGANISSPDEMEFRPAESSGRPNRNNYIALYINDKVIPLGRKIKMELEKTHGAIGLWENEKRADELSITFEKKHIISGTNIGRILVPWRGTGWGQSARITAKTKKPDGNTVYATGKILLEQPEEEGGIIKDVKYRPLENDMCSHIVDGIIYINSNHYLNKVVFGPDEKSYAQKIDNDRTAQYRFSAVVVEQGVFRLAEQSYFDDALQINPEAPVTSLREFIDKQTNVAAPKIIKAFMTK